MPCVTNYLLQKFSTESRILRIMIWLWGYLCTLIFFHQFIAIFGCMNDFFHVAIPVSLVAPEHSFSFIGIPSWI